MRYKIAKLISFAGNPLITLPVFIIAVMFSKENFNTAILVSCLLVGGVFLPLTIWIFIKWRRGLYSNFDVSVRAQRKSLYFFVLPLLAIVTLLLFITGQSSDLCISVLFALILTVVSLLVNLIIKCSLHVALTLYLAALFYTLNPVTGIFVFFLTFLIGWSRIALQRHTGKEVAVGFLVGFVLSIIMLLVEGKTGFN